MLDNYAIVYMNTVLLADELEQNPPQLPFEVYDDDFYQELLQSAKYGAHQYDAYNSIVSCSMLYTGDQPSQLECTHWFMCDELPDDSTVRGESPPTNIHVMDNERDLVAGFMHTLSNIMVILEDGRPLRQYNIAGWDVSKRIWPIIVNKCFKYGVRVPKTLRVDITDSFVKLKNFVDINQIYNQGAYSGIRKTPACADVLAYWGIPATSLGGYMPPQTLRDLICEDQTTAAKAINDYLRGMAIAFKKYTN